MPTETDLMLQRNTESGQEQLPIYMHLIVAIIIVFVFNSGVYNFVQLSFS